MGIAKNIVYAVSSLVILLILTGCGNSKKNITKLDDLKNVSIGAMTGSTGEQQAKKKFPEAVVKSFDDIMDAVAALKSDQLDAVITALPAATNVCKHNPELQLLSEPVDYEDTEIAVKKGNDKLLAELNDIISGLKKDGTLDDMRRRWLKKDLSPYEKIDLPLPQKGELLKIGTSATREPFCFMDANHNVSGFDGELARRISIKLQRPIEFVDMKFSALIASLQAGKVDIIIAGMTGTDERKKKINFTQPYFQNSQVVIVKKANSEQPLNQSKTVELRTVDDIKNKRLGVLQGSVHDTYTMKNFPQATVLQYKSPSELILAVRSGKVDAAIYTTETLAEIVKADNDLKILGDTLFSVPVAIGFNKKNDELRQKFNAFLKKIKTDGTFVGMLDRWMVKGETDMPEIKNSGSNGTLAVGTVSDKGLPFTVIKDNKMIGFDVELTERFAAYLGKKLKWDDMDFGSLIISAATNKIDMITSTLMITEERKKQIAFSDPYLRLGASVFALKKNIVESYAAEKMHSLDDIANKKVGVYSGTIHDGFVANKFPGAEIKRYNSTADMILALKTGKIDVAFSDLYSAKVLMKNNPEIGILTDDALSMKLGIGFSKNNPALKDKFNEYLKTIKSDGTFDAIYKRWFVDDPEKTRMPDFNFKKDAPKITLGVAVGDLPYSAFLNGKYVGFDIELLKTFANRKGYNLNIKTMDFSALVAALASGKVDMIADGIAITAERQKQVDFSDAYMDFKTAVLALNKNLGEDSNAQPEKSSETFSFLKGIADSFHNNIIVEKRYLLILDGLKTTAVISVLSILFGTLFGSLICFMRMSHRKILQLPAKIYISILRGTPVLVVLMIIFYVVFASVDIDPVIVAVIAFGLNFAAYVSEMYRTGIEGVDKGQTEAGIAMGFTKVKTFVYIVLPQAAKRILPVYKGEVISLVKMTSIVGYIAVQDLTKASDIIRSRTFDAFFPLIMVAVLYFLVSWLLMLLLGYAERITNPKPQIKRG